MTWWWTVPVIVGFGMLSGWGAGSGFRNGWFAALHKPWFMPPGWLFPVVWTTLYVLMGIAAARVIDARGVDGRGLALALFAAQLLLNLAWSPLFFAAHRIGAALALIVALDALVVATIAACAGVDRVAAALLLPYLLWLALATALNRSILRLNR